MHQLPSAPPHEPTVDYGIESSNLHETAWEFIERLEADGHTLDMPTLIILTGDRISCCTELIAAHAVTTIGDETRQRIAGLCSLAPDGEQASGTPTIVAVAVRPDFRQAGIGRELLIRGIARLRELIADRDPEAKRILIEAVTKNCSRLTRSVLERDAGAYADIDFHDHSRFFS